MWLNERVMEAASVTLSFNTSIRQMQIEAWEEFMNGDTDDARSTALIAAGLQRIKLAVEELYKPGDLITSHNPEDSATPLTYLMLRSEPDGEWTALCEGEIQRLPLRFFLVEDHTLLSRPPPE